MNTTGMMQVQFAPRKDMTAFELAMILGNIIMIQGVDGQTGTLLTKPIFVNEQGWNEMPQGVQRHFTLTLAS